MCGLLSGVVDDHRATLGVRRARHAGVQRDTEALQGGALVGWRGDELEQAGLLLQDEDGGGFAAQQLAGGVDESLEQGVALESARQEAADFVEAFESGFALGRHGVELGLCSAQDALCARLIIIAPELSDAAMHRYLLRRRAI